MTKLDTKTQLLNIAETALRQRGFDGFSNADLADVAGIRKASIHYHFPTKADLSVALMDRYCNTVQGACDDIDASHASAGARLRALIGYYRASLGDGSTICLCVALSTSRESLSQELVGKMIGFRQIMIGWLKVTFEQGAGDGSIEGGTQAGYEAKARLALLEGAQLAARVDRDIRQFDEAVALLLLRCKR